MNTFATFQPIIVNDDTLADHGRAGHVTSAERTEGAGKNAAQVVDVLLDASATEEQHAVTVPVTSLKPL